MKTSTTLKAFAVAGSLLLGSTAAQAATECGTKDKITIAEMTWLSAGSLAYLTRDILKNGYGCDVEV